MTDDELNALIERSERVEAMLGGLEGVKECIALAGYVPVLAKRVLQEEREHLETIKSRDAMEERVNEICGTLQMSETDMQWSNLNDPAERAKEYILTLQREIDRLNDQIQKLGTAHGITLITQHELIQALRKAAMNLEESASMHKCAPEIEIYRICNGKGSVIVNWEARMNRLLTQLSISDDVKDMSNKELAAFIVNNIWSQIPLDSRLSHALDEMIERLEAK